MTTTLLQRLEVESFEDRLVPSHLPFGSGDRPAHHAPPSGERSAPRGDFAERPRPERAGPAADHARVSRQLDAANPPQPRGDQITTANPPHTRNERIVTPTRAETVSSQPVQVIVVPPQAPVAVLAEGPSASLSIAAPTAPGTAPLVPPTPPTPEPAPPVENPATPPVPSFVANAVQAAIVLYGTTVVPEPVVENPLDQPSVSRPEVAPAPTLIQQVVEAMYADAIPFAGMLPFHAADLEAAAGGLLAKLDELGADVVQDLFTPEQWAWVTGAALVTGGAVYVARGTRNRLSRATPPGTESALASWEDRHADRPA